MVAVTSWGRLGAFEHRVHPLSDRMQVAARMSRDAYGLAYGMGRSYGDVCLNPGGVLWNTTGLDRFISFDEHQGRLVCESGLLIRDIQRLCVPRGWMLPVVPGTQFVTVGGAIANDIHGKNHHLAGSFGDHVRRLSLARTDGSLSECRPGEALFEASVGGLGLTGVITEAELQLKRIPGPWLSVETLPYRDLSEFFALSDASETDWEHIVSWVDCLNGEGRGIFMRANAVDAGHDAPPASRSLSMPFVPPVSLVNPLSLRPFNTMYFHLKKAKRTSVQHYEAFFHPLDHVRNWNRIYGPRGFFQYQCVLPRELGQPAVQAMLRRIARSGTGSFLAVLKTFGNRQSTGMLSFARPGVTLALDFPNQGESTLHMLAALDAIVRECRGRLYMAKDARMPVDLFESGYPRLKEFLSLRDPGISSAMSRRLLGS